MSNIFRRDQRRFIVLAAVATSFLLLFVLHSQDRLPSSPQGLSWGSPKPKTGLSAIAIGEELENEAPNEDPYHPSPHTENAQSPPVAQPAAPSPVSVNLLAPSDLETTIPQAPKSLDSDVMVDVWSYGFSIFDKLYVKNGTFYAVTSRKESFPPKEGILTKIIIELEEGPYNPAEDRLQYLTPSEAKDVLGDYATVIPGMTMFIADPPQYLPHFYHFWGEVIIGAWRVYSVLGFSKDNNGSLDRLSFPDRWIMPFIDREDEWRDKAGLNAPLMRLAFPSASIEKSEIWKDWIKSGNTLVFERSMVINRRAAHKSPLGFTWFKMISGTQNVSVPSNFWEPLRKSVTKNLFGYVPEVAASGKALVVPKFKHSKETAATKPHSIKPIVTYISRQSTGRRLIDADHQGLVAALKELAMEGICEVRIPIMEHLTLQEQMAEITSSTIMIGVHGNGLTHQLFMPPSLRSAVFEIQPPGDYAFDYWMLSRNVGHKHYMVRNDTLTTYGPEEWHEGVNMGPLFHTTSIPVYGPVIADMVRKRLTQPERDVEP